MLRMFNDSIRDVIIMCQMSLIKISYVKINIVIDDNSIKMRLMEKLILDLLINIHFQYNI